MIGGVLNFLFAIGLHGYLSKERLTRAGVASIMLSSVFLALVGIFTLDYLVMHAVVALGYFMLAPAGFVLVGFGTEKDGIRTLSIACGIAALLTLLVLPIAISALSIKVGFAIPELVEILIISAWTIFVSAKLIEKPMARRVTVWGGKVLSPQPKKDREQANHLVAKCQKAKIRKVSPSCFQLYFCIPRTPM